MVICEALKLLPKREAELILSHITGFSISELIFQRNKSLTESEEKKFIECVERRNYGEPVQYIIGECEFMSLDFLVNEDVLIPRSDTEVLVEYIISKFKEREASFLDIGTGSGCIGISILKYCPKTKALLVDISEGALNTSKKNAELNKVRDRADFKILDILSQIPDTKFDFVVSNPPYIRPDVIEGLERDVKDFEPYTALFGGEDGLMFYRRITEIAPKILKDDGILAYEIGYDQAEDVSKLLERNFSNIKVLKDLCGNNRVVIGKLKRT